MATTDPRVSRVELIGRRWASLLSLGAIAAAFALLARRLVATPHPVLSDLIGLLATPLGATAALVLAVAAAWPFGRGRWLAFLGIHRFRYFFSYPPLGVAATVGLVVLVLAERFFGDRGYAVGVWDDLCWLGTGQSGWALLSVAVAAILVVAVTRFRRRRAQKSSEPASEAAPEEKSVEPSENGSNRPSDDDSRPWYWDDGPIADPREDRFGAVAVAERIAAHLKNDVSPTVALIGPRGSGKTSIRQLVEHELRTTESVVMVPISLWPYESSEAAVRGILQRLVDAIGQRVNVLAIEGVPQRYLRSIEVMSGYFGRPAAARQEASNPDDVIARVANATRAAGLRVVVWIEDFERFARTRPDGSAVDGDTGPDRVGPILSLLHTLDVADGVAVAIADESLGTTVDVGKLARFVELTPLVPPEKALAELKLVREKMLSKDFIDSVKPSVRRSIVEQQLPAKADVAWAQDRARVVSLGISGAGALGSLALLCRRPRALKSVCREFDAAWTGDLLGEIDIDDLLALTVLREAAKDVFAFIVDHSDSLRLDYSPLAPVAAGEGRPESHPQLQELRRLLQETSPSLNESDAGNIIRDLFPLMMEQEHQSTRTDREKRPQRVGAIDHRDYLRVAAMRQQPSSGDADQLVLREIRQLTQFGEPGELARRLLDERRSPQLLAFWRLIDAENAIRLFHAVVDLHRTTAESPNERFFPGLAPLSQVLEKVGVDEAAVSKAISTAIDEMAPSNIPLVHDVIHLFADPSRSRRSLVSLETAESLWRSACEAFIDAFRDNPENLPEALRDGSPWTLYWLFWRLPRIQDNSLPEIPFDPWEEAAEIMTKAAEERPDDVARYLVPFAVRSELEARPQGDAGAPPQDAVRLGGAIAWYDAETASRLFNEDRLLKIFDRAVLETPDTAGDQSSPQFKAACRAAKQAAARRLGHNDSKPPAS